MTAETLFPPQALDLYREIEQSDDPYVREELMLELAEVVLNVHDQTDMELNEDYHSIFEEMERRRTEYRQSSMRVARLVCSGIAHLQGMTSGNESLN